jgi:predicted AlkP superfamily pyrophosphatase or phosphodiesterase
MNLTGPGHAVILSGAYGNANGIICNNWYDIDRHRGVYCVADSTVSLVGVRGNGVSPANFIGSTFGDELRLASGFRSKVISISNKDRAAILLGGKFANAAFWEQDSLFVTSSYYAPSLPAWAAQFNDQGEFTRYFGKWWRQDLPESAFNALDRDDAPYEADEDGFGKTFPHHITGEDTTRITSSYYHALIRSPYGAKVLAEFAKAAVHGEQLGQRGVTDLLCISFSSTDYVGHAFGPHSREILEITVAIDSILSDLLRYLDNVAGPGKYVVALTSDHGVAPIPEYIKAHVPRADVGRISSDSVAAVERALTKTFGPPPGGRRWVEAVADRYLYLDQSTLIQKKLDAARVARVAADVLVKVAPLTAAFTRAELQSPSPTSLLAQYSSRSYYPQRSGDILVVPKPFYFGGSEPTGTTHGEPYDYSSHVPLLIMGPGIHPGAYTGESSPADLAPTLSVLFGVEFPAGREGRVLSEALK